MESGTAVETVEAIDASVSALAAFVRRATGNAVPGTDGVALTGDPDSAGVDPLRDQADAHLDGLAELAKVEAQLAALKVQLVAGYAKAEKALASPAESPQDRTVREMAVTSEIACVLTISERAASALLCDALELTTVRPLTLSALQAGALSWQHARIMVDETANLDPAGAAALEAHFLDPDAPEAARGIPAGELVPCRFRAKVRTWRERHHPVSIEKRHARSTADRRVEYAPDRDGMAWFSAYLPADQAAGIWDRTTGAARAMQGPDEARTLTQLRADVTSAWLLTAGLEQLPSAIRDAAGEGAADGSFPGRDPAGLLPAGGVPSPVAQVLVTVPALSLLCVTEEPAMLDGYGPIPPSMARALVADGATSFRRVLIDPRDGAPLEIGRTSYRIPKPLRQWLRLRDAKCTFPNCNNHSLDNEADHLLAWARGGPTGISNLAQPCPKHHRLKHNSAWTPTAASANDPPGWTSPTGRHYPSEQPDWEPPHWPPHIQAILKALDSGVPEQPGLPESSAPPETAPGTVREAA